MEIVADRRNRFPVGFWLGSRSLVMYIYIIYYIFGLSTSGRKLSITNL